MKFDKIYFNSSITPIVIHTTKSVETIAGRVIGHLILNKCFARSKRFALHGPGIAWINARNLTGVLQSRSHMLCRGSGNFPTLVLHGSGHFAELLLFRHFKLEIVSTAKNWQKILNFKT